MTPQTTVAPAAPLEPRDEATGTQAATRPFYWSVRREIWENRSITVAPLVVAIFVLLGSLVSLVAASHGFRALADDGASASRSLAAQVAKPLRMAPAPIMLATFLVGLFYSLDALYGERRERSLLFWKSMPVSDRTTVLAKVAIPVVALPSIALLLSWLVYAVLVAAASAVLTAKGVGPGALGDELSLFAQPLIMAYGLAAHALWFAPIYAYLLLASAWARRLPLLWAALPPFVIALVEHVAFRTDYLAALLKYRLAGAMSTAFATASQAGGDGEVDRLGQLTPATFLTTPGLWLGLFAAAAFLVAAARLRRDREPI